MTMAATTEMSHVADFTTAHYRSLIQLAKRRYAFRSYSDFQIGDQFVLWRHDCDYSLNRALALARIEAEEGVRATYFVNPHCEFYNVLERSQTDVLQQILALGHDIGLHFDGVFHSTADEAELERQLACESSLLALAIGVRPHAFSFHNPSAFHLNCVADAYAGMVNCYSETFKTQVPYCSDSNGHWRYRRLHDVLEAGSDRCLQVLTHPGWWQDEVMTPRQRILRCIYGRADATVRFYDGAIDAGGRTNPSGPPILIAFLRRRDPLAYALCDELMHRRAFGTMLLELQRLHLAQVTRLCLAHAVRCWSVPLEDAKKVLLNVDGATSASALLDLVFGDTWRPSAGAALQRVQDIERNPGFASELKFAPGALTEEACAAFCDLMTAVAQWGIAGSAKTDGLVHGEWPAAEATRGSAAQEWDRVREALEWKAIP